MLCHGVLVVPSGHIPGDGEVDAMRLSGPDYVPQSLMEVLAANVQGHGCNFLFLLGLDVIPDVSLTMF